MDPWLVKGNNDWDPTNSCWVSVWVSKCTDTNNASCANKCMDHGLV